MRSLSSICIYIKTTTKPDPILLYEKIRKRKMGCRQLSMIVLFLWVFQFPDKTVVSSAVEEKGTVFVYGRAAVGTVDEDFICATLDWWPPQKCDYGTCAWDHASILNLVFFFLSFTFLPFLFLSKTMQLVYF